MGEVYTVIELQVVSNQAANIVTSFTTLPEAENKFHTVAAAAAISSVERHTVLLIDSQGFKIERASFDHNVE